MHNEQDVWLLLINNSILLYICSSIIKSFNLLTKEYDIKVLNY